MAKAIVTETLAENGRRIPAELAPVVAQAMLNVAVNTGVGFTIEESWGLSTPEAINEAYDAWLAANLPLPSGEVKPDGTEPRTHLDEGGSTALGDSRGFRRATREFNEDAHREGY